MYEKIDPNHYVTKDGDKKGTRNFIRESGDNFAIGTAIRYIARAGRKPGESELTDIKKALWYLCDLLEVTEKSKKSVREIENLFGLDQDRAYILYDLLYCTRPNTHLLKDIIYRLEKIASNLEK